MTLEMGWCRSVFGLAEHVETVSRGLFKLKIRFQSTHGRFLLLMISCENVEIVEASHVEVFLDCPYV